MSTQSTVTGQPQSSDGRLRDKVVIITGASSGIGRAAMEIFGREGATVVGTARNEARLNEALEAAKAAGGNGKVIAADLEDTSSQDRIVQETLEAFGRIDVLVNNAGVGWQYGIDNPGSMAPIHEATLENWREIIGGVDLEGYYLAIRAVLPHMLEQGSGSVVNVSSMAGVTGLYDAHAYTAAKGAIVNLTRSMAITYAKSGVRVNTVCPGFADTPMIAPVANIFDDEQVANALVPLGRPAQPSEIANALLFFASDESSYCTGSTLLVDGGCTARGFTA